MRSQQLGMTLIELMIVVAVISVLAAIAYPSYQNQVLKSHRAEGKMALMQTAQQMERCFTASSTFTGCVTFPFTTEHGRYQISVSPTTPVTTYTLSAAPQGAQNKDTRCATLTYTDANVKGKTGTASLSECW